MLPIIFIPGMMCDTRLFAPQINMINNRVVSIAPITNHDNIEDLASEVLDNAPPFFILAGLSMGGTVAMEIIRQASSRVKALCLMDTNPLAENDENKAKRQPQLDKIKLGYLKDVMRDEMKPHYLYESNQRQDILDLCMDMALGLGDQVFINQSLALKNRIDQCETLKSYDGDVLILHGKDDRLCPAHRHELLHQLMPQSDYHIIPKSGHLPTIEQPQACNDILLNWLTKLGK